jgi:hypothetical protein
VDVDLADEDDSPSSTEVGSADEDDAPSMGVGSAVDVLVEVGEDDALLLMGDGVAIVQVFPAKKVVAPSSARVTAEPPSTERMVFCAAIHKIPRNAAGGNM